MALEYIHNKNIIHRDIKPDNFVIGKGDKSKNIYLLDFGLAKKYRSSKTLEHYPIIKHKNLTGTARYASINALNGLTQSRRDDLEAVGYVLLYFLRGKLPWQGLHVKKKEYRYKKIMEIKIETSPEELCKNFPQEFTLYIKYCRKLEYEEEPDYKYLMSLFNNILRRYSENIYDWDIINKPTITANTSSTSKKPLNLENINNKLDESKNNNKNKFSDKVKKNIIFNKNFQSLETKEFIISNTNRSNANNKYNTIVDNDNYYDNISEFSEEENINNKCPNIFGKIHNKEQLEKSFDLNKTDNNEYCIIV